MAKVLSSAATIATTDRNLGLMPSIGNVARRAANYWWLRRVRFAAPDLDPLSSVATVGLQTK